ncbi:MAG: DUF3160 domain-containing protein [Promethearchaeota archaeon]
MMIKRKNIATLLVCIILLQAVALGAAFSDDFSFLDSNIQNFPILENRSLSSSPQIDNWSDSIEFFDEINNLFDLSSAELDMLWQNKFLVLNRLGTDDIMDAYDLYWDADVPVFITTDTMLNVWHLMFKEILKNMESEVLYPILNLLVTTMAGNVSSILDLDACTVEERDIAIYLAVATQFCIVDNPSSNETNYSIPNQITNEVNVILAAVEDELSFDETLTQFSTTELKWFIDDYSQYTPRGHYTETETLQNYFKLFKWLSRRPFFFGECCNGEVLDRNPLQMVKSATLLTWLLHNAYIEWNNIWVSGAAVWDSYDYFLDMLIGVDSQVVSADINAICDENFGEEWTYRDLTDDQFTTIQTQINGDQSIPYPLLDALVVYYNVGCMPDSTPKTFYFLGERYVVDADIMRQFAYPYIANKMYSSGLEVAATCMYSVRAEELLANDPLASLILDQVSNLQENISSLPDELRQPLTWKMQETLYELVKSSNLINNGSIANLPLFMESKPWYDEKLTTVLGAWAQIRHDTVLYTQQTYSSTWCSTPAGYVEPYPEFYEKMGKLSLFLASTFDQMAFLLSEDMISKMEGLELFYNRTQMLRNISIHQLEGIELSNTEKEFICSIYEEPNESGDMILKGWLAEILKRFNTDFVQWDRTYPHTEASSIVDVFTEVNENPDGVLEIGTGFLEHILALVPGWGISSLQMLTVGPVFSYYEFRSNVDHRLTEDEWRGILYTFPDNTEIEWDSSQIFRGLWAASYMIDIAKTQSVIYDLEFIDREWVQYTIPDFPEWLKGSDFTLFRPNYPEMDLFLDETPVYARDQQDFSGWSITYEDIDWSLSGQPPSNNLDTDDQSENSQFPKIAGYILWFGCIGLCMVIILRKRQNLKCGRKI